MPARSAAATAMTAATLDVLSEGRFLLGIGSSGPQVSEGWHGGALRQAARPDAGLRRRAADALARERLEYHGETLDLPLPGGPGKALKLTIAPVQERSRSTCGDRAAQHAARREIADGVMPTLFSPEHVSVCATSCRPGSTGRGTARPWRTSTSPRRSRSWSRTTSRGADVMRPFVALYVGGMGSREKNFYNQLVQRYGFEAPRGGPGPVPGGPPGRGHGRRCPTRSSTGSRSAGRRRSSRAPGRLPRAGVGTLGVTPMAFSKEERLEQLRLVAELAA
jgi:alkanesulfonate monooxygenase SsuD/methylene tetrahydromethanopterin reductase-like flavin-dependent oxidoreductase (luciferase family)